MATTDRFSQSEAAAVYEQHLRSRWDTLTPFEQEEARAYLHAKFLPDPALPSASDGPGWTIPVGYLCAGLSLAFLPILFAPAGFGLGVYNAAKGRAGHGIAQIMLSIVFGIVGMILGFLAWSV
jgi:hypothetical protein